MRIVEKKVEAGEAVPGKKEKPTVEYGKEDLFLVFIVGFILIGLGLGKLTFEAALGYFGVTSAGGVWGLFGGRASSK